MTPQYKEDLDKHEKKIKEQRLNTLQMLRDVYFICGKNKKDNTFLKTTYKENDDDNKGLYFLVNHVVQVIAKCYFLDLPEKYSPQDKDNISKVKANIEYMCEYFEFEMDKDDLVTVKTLLLELIARERGGKTKKKMTSI